MAHRYKVREIAQQSGLSEATVDRVLQRAARRAGEHPRRGHAGDRRPGQAARPAAAQRPPLPHRRRHADPAAVLRRVPGRGRGRTARLRARDAAGAFPPVGVGLDRADGRRARPACAAATAWSSRRRTNPRSPRPSTGSSTRGVPVVTYATDVPASARCATSASTITAPGVTAAYLMNQWLGSAPSDVLITLSRTVFRGEGEREVGFRSALRGSGREIVEVSDSDGIDATNERLVLDALERHPAVEAVYSAGRRQHRDRRRVRTTRPRLPGLHRPRPRRRQPAAAARRPHLGGPAQRPARRRPAGDAADPAGARRAARRAGAAGADPGDHAVQPARLTAESSKPSDRRYHFAPRRRGRAD